MNKKTVLFVLAALVVGSAGGYFASNRADLIGGTIRTLADHNYAGFYAGGSDQFAVSSAGVLTSSGAATLTGGLTVGSGGTSLSKYYCATASWNPPSIGTSSVNLAATSTDIALTGAVMGDSCIASLSSATTSAASVNCFVTGTATATIRLLNLGTTALDLSTGTAKVCYIH